MSSRIDPHAHMEEKKLHRLPVDVPGCVITVSDRCSTGEKEDLSGPLAVELLAAHRIQCTHRLIPDGVESVTEALRSAIADGARVIVTTGGTGVTERDLTPEGTAPLLSVRLDALAQQVIAHGLRHTPLAGLSRALIGITERGSQGVLIINAPGSRGGVRDTLHVMAPLIPHILEQCDPVNFALIPQVSES